MHPHRLCQSAARKRDRMMGFPLTICVGNPSSLWRHLRTGAPSEGLLVQSFTMHSRQHWMHSHSLGEHRRVPTQTLKPSWRPFRAPASCTPWAPQLAANFLLQTYFQRCTENSVLCSMSLYRREAAGVCASHRGAGRDSGRLPDRASGAPRRAHRWKHAGRGAQAGGRRIPKQRGLPRGSAVHHRCWGEVRVSYIRNHTVNLSGSRHDQ